MTDVQLDIKATEASLAYNVKYAEDSVLNDMLSRPSDFVPGCIKSVVDMLRKKAYRDGYEQGFKELEKENEQLISLAEDLEKENERMKGILLRNDETIKTLNDIKNQKCIEIEELKKNAIVWHKVICFDEPDENGYITASNPAEEGKEYLLLLKNKRFVISELGHYSDGYFFDDFAWEDIEAWAELPEV